MKASERNPRTESRGQETAQSRQAAVQEALARAHGGCPFACERRVSLPSRMRGSDAGRAGPPCCRNCVYAVPLQDGSRELLVCTGCPLCPGKMRVTEELQCCRSFQKRRRQSERTVPPEPPDESVRYIPLTKGKYAIIDAADYERVAKFKWCASGSGRRIYACRRQGPRIVYLHCLLKNAPKGMVVDHKDGDPLNDRQSNLRICTQRQNTYNSPPRGGTSQFKGVAWNRRARKWQARIQCDGRKFYLGLFRDEAEAARAYDRKAHELFGEYAYLNFPEEIRECCRKTGRRVG